MFTEEAKSSDITNAKHLFSTSIISGAAAGIICDIIFFPLDTLKTRLQSQHGFLKSGGYKQLYHGIGPVMIGSAPAAALFFITYEGLKEFLQPQILPQYHAFIHMGAASLGEMVACLIRVPVEVLKQRRQALLADVARLKLRTLFRGYGSTVLRDMPFGCIQMPLWEYFKVCWKQHVHHECTPLEGAYCGAASVAVSAAITTPLDVAKTRIMLSSTTADKKEVKISTMLKEVYRDNGPKGYGQIASFYYLILDYSQAFFQGWVALLLVVLYFLVSMNNPERFVLQFSHIHQTKKIKHNKNSNKKQKYLCSLCKVSNSHFLKYFIMFIH